jgi:hypothetical protein
VGVNNAAPCNDGDSCTVNDVCSGGGCTASPKVCSEGKICQNGECITVEVIVGHVTIENAGSCAGDELDDDWYDCNKDPNNASCSPLGGHHSEGECVAYYANYPIGAPVEACQCLFDPAVTKANDTGNISPTGCKVWACVK